MAGLEDMCKKLQASVDDLGLKVANLAQSNSNLVMEIDSVSESFTEPPQRKPMFTPPCSAMDIIDELSDRDKRKKNIIVYLLKNSLAVKKGAALFKMASVKKVVKSKGRPRNGCDGIG